MPQQAGRGFIGRVGRTVDRYRMLATGDRVLVAVSGGPDSVALLAALASLAPRRQLTLHAAHLNHGLRVEESVRDQRCAERVTTALGVPLTVEAVGEPLAGPGLEARARELRYAFLTRVASRLSCDRIATGHTLDDQAETVLMRLLRGTGWDGMAGILPVRGGVVVRPLIECRRSDVLDFLSAVQLEFCEDSSNSDRRFLRNRIRHEIIPQLRSLNPLVCEHLAGIASRHAEEGRFLEEQAAALQTAATAPDGSLSIGVFAAAPAALQRRIMRAWLRSVRGNLRGIGAAHVEAMYQAALGDRASAAVSLPGGTLVVREYDWLRVASRIPPGRGGNDRTLIPGAVVDTRSGWRIRAEVVPGPVPPPSDLATLVADARALPDTLVVRAPRPGDRIHPLGLNGRRKLQDVFVDRKVPRAAREGYPVIEAAGQILWLPGLIRSRQALVTGTTRSVLRLEARKTGIAGAESLC
jgi:tRNA(Ile)-lysidine synthase